MRKCLFPPESKEIQFDEKWSFVRKKEKNCHENEESFGEQWDHIAIDAESRLVLSVVVGKRTPENCRKLVEDTYNRTGERKNILLSSDCFSSYKTTIKDIYGSKSVPKKKKGITRTTKKPVTVIPEELCYVTVCKEYEKGKVSSIKREIVFGKEELVINKLKNSKVSTTINTAFVERNNGTDRMQNSRKVRDTYGFSKDLFYHISIMFLVYCLYNFCWCVRTLKYKNDGNIITQTPAMAAGLESHIWTVGEWITYPVYDMYTYYQINNISHAPKHAPNVA